MKLAAKLGFGRGRKLAIAPFGGDLRPEVIAPQRAIAGFALREFIIFLLLVIALVMSGMNLGLSYIAQRKADAIPYVADGSPFGCQVEEMRQ